MNDSPINFDWVQARASCSLESVFHTLREVLDSDVKTANRLKLRGSEFDMSAPVATKIIVTRKRDLYGMAEGDGRVFELLPNEIRVKNARTETILLSAKPELNISGDCLLKIDRESEPLRLWQFSKMALEDLFFGA